MATWQAIVGGTTYNLSDSNPFDVISVTGIGNAPVRRLEERGPFQDGVTDVGYRFDPRIINLVIAVHSNSNSAADTNRDTLSAIFNPTGNALIKLRCTRDDSSVRQIDCYAVNMVDMPAAFPERVLSFQRVGVQLKAPNPFWYNPTQQSEGFSTDAVAAWYTGGGVIGTANVLANSTNPSVGTIFGSGSIGASSPFTILARTTLDLVPTVDETNYLYYSPSQVHFIYGTVTANVQVRAGDAYFYIGTADFATFASGGTVALFLVRDGNVVSFYEGTALRAQTTIIEDRGPAFALANLQWRQNTGAPDDWNPTVTHAAVYDYALSAAERNSVIAAMNATFYSQAQIDVAGNVPEYPVITLTGPMANPVIENSTTGETLDFTGSTINGSVTYTIDTRYGYKEVIDSNAANRIAQLTDDSDLATFHLQPGGNLVSLTTSGTSSASTATIYYYNRYIGL